MDIQLPEPGTPARDIMDATAEQFVKEMPKERRELLRGVMGLLRFHEDESFIHDICIALIEGRLNVVQQPYDDEPDGEDRTDPDIQVTVVSGNTTLKEILREELVKDKSKRIKVRCFSSYEKLAMSDGRPVTTLVLDIDSVPELCPQREIFSYHLRDACMLQGCKDAKVVIFTAYVSSLLHHIIEDVRKQRPEMRIEVIQKGAGGIENVWEACE